VRCLTAQCYVHCSNPATRSVTGFKTT
jgi:hypothetical protein